MGDEGLKEWAAGRPGCRGASGRAYWSSGGEEEHLTGSWFGTLNLGVSPFAPSWGGLSSRAWEGQGVGLAFVLGGMPSVNTHHLVGRPVGDDGAPGASLVPQPPPATLCCSPDRQTLAQSWWGGCASTTRPIWEPALFSDSRKHLFLPLRSERAGSRPRAQSPACPHWAGSGDWGRARSPILCQTPTRHRHLQGLLARCNRVLPSAPTKMPEAVTAFYQVQGLLGQTRSCPRSAMCVY